MSIEVYLKLTQYLWLHVISFFSILAPPNTILMLMIYSILHEYFTIESNLELWLQLKSVWVLLYLFILFVGFWDGVSGELYYFIILSMP